MLVGGLTHGDTALETAADFLAVSEHRLIPARVRCEWAELRRKGVHSVWAPASQEGSHVGHAGVGVVSLKGPPFLCPLLQLQPLGSFFSLAGWFGVCYLWVIVGSCTWWWFTVIRVPMRMLKNSVLQTSHWGLPCASWRLLLGDSLAFWLVTLTSSHVRYPVC